MDRRKVALGLLIGGGLIAAYFMVAFDIAAPGTNIVNMGRMNDRSNGLIFGGLMAIVGTILYVTAPPASARTISIAQPAPIAPQGFWMDVSAALGYPTLSPSKSQTSLAAYRAQLRQIGVFLSDPQGAWAWSHGVPTSQAGLFVGYVEAHRTWARTAGLPGIKAPAVNPKVAWVVGGFVVLYLFGRIIVQTFRPSEGDKPSPSYGSDSNAGSITERSGHLRYGQAEGEAKEIMGDPDIYDAADNNPQVRRMVWNEAGTSVSAFFREGRIEDAERRSPTGRVTIIASSP